MTDDLRVPDFGASRTELFATALDQAAWADDLGFEAERVLMVVYRRHKR